MTEMTEVRDMPTVGHVCQRGQDKKLPAPKVVAIPATGLCANHDFKTGHPGLRHHRR